MRKQENPNDDHDPSVGSSSIALLQERFRQLHKEKEMREGKKLLKLGEGFASSKKHFGPWQSATCSQPSVSRSNAPQRPIILHDSLPKELDVPVMQKGYGGDANHAASPETKTWPNDSDVDTSLHL